MSEKSQTPESMELELERLAKLIADIPDADPPDTLLPSVMSALKPKRLPWWKRIHLKFYLPISITPAKLIPAGLGLVLFAFAVFYFGFTLGVKKVKPLEVKADLSPAETTTVVFTLKEPKASKVYVIGSFNHWLPDGYAMHYDRKRGVWTLAVRLPAGRYEYAYLLNGKTIMPDPNALMQKDDGFGNKNSILIVERDDETERRS